MTVAELIAFLGEHDPEAIVVMSSDAEGNSYSPLSRAWGGAYRAETTWSGDVGLATLTPEDEAAGYDEDDVMDDGVPALVLVPVR